MFETPIHMDPDVQVAALLDHRDGRMKLESVYSGYVEAAREFSLPVVIGTPTFRAGPNFIRRAGLPEEDIGRLNRQAAGFLKDVREKGWSRTGLHRGRHRPGAATPTCPGRRSRRHRRLEYHRPQAEALAVAGVDFLFAPTFPSVDEAEGACIAMARTGVPHVISFILGPEGDVLDGTPLAAAINRIDDNPDARPLYFSLSCIHALAAAEAVAKLKADSAPASWATRRVQGKRLAAQDGPAGPARPSRKPMTRRLSPPRWPGCSILPDSTYSGAVVGPMTATFGPWAAYWRIRARTASAVPADP